jgi:N-acetyl-anhydromuramyl-L-alanine amidase AmpD
VSIWAGYAASYTPGRARPIQFVTLHYTAGSEGPLSAEGGVAYDKRRSDGTSCHYFTDSQGPALQEVPDGDRSHSARWHGNEIGIHIEICGTVQTRAQWLDPVSLATLTTTAELVRELCDRHGLEKRRLTVAETRAAYYGKTKPTGINDHYSCTYAFPEDGGDHTDVGPEFPWDVFMEMVTEGGDMADSDLVQGDAWRTHCMATGEQVVPAGPTKGEGMWITAAIQELREGVRALSTGNIDVAALAAALVADPGFSKAIEDAAFRAVQRAEDE